jgi:AraC-like DNA-binding protein
VALERLAAGERDLTALALDLGFADHAHLTNTVRRELGRPPSAFRAAPNHAEIHALSTILQA